MVTAEDIEPIKRTRLSEEVLKRLQKMIIEGSLKPGDQLPCERELAEMFQVSRASIREALRILEAMGFIEARVGVGGGTYVKAISIEGLLNPFSEILGCEKELIVEMIEFRRVLEVENCKGKPHRSALMKIWLAWKRVLNSWLRKLRMAI